MAESSQTASTPRPVSVLVVDDEAAVADVVAGMLEDLGCLVETRGDVSSAIERLVAGPLPELVLSDVRMPGPQNGIDLARFVPRRFPHIPFAFMSGFPGGDFEEANVVLLCKPVTDQMLAGLVAQVRQAVSTS